MEQNKIFIIDDVTVIDLLKDEKIKYYVRKINNTETGEITEKYCDKIEEIIKKKYNVDVVLYGDFTVTKEMLCF